MSEFKREPGTGLQHRDGIPWYDAKRPHRWHRCRAQTRAVTVIGPPSEITERCACGAINIQQDGERPHWLKRNWRRDRVSGDLPGRRLTRTERGLRQ